MAGVGTVRGPADTAGLGPTVWTRRESAPGPSPAPALKPAAEAQRSGNARLTPPPAATIPAEVASGGGRSGRRASGTHD